MKTSTLIALGSLSLLALSRLDAASPFQDLANRQGAPAPEFFREIAPGQETRLSDVPNAIRQRNVQLNLDLLQSDEQHPTQVEALTFTLFPDVVLTGELELLEGAYGGGFVAVFTLRDDPYGHAYLSVMGEAATATFRAGGRLFQMHHVGDGEHTISEVNELLYQSCGTSTAPRGHEEVTPGAGGGSGRATTAQVLDMLVLYTDDARVGNGGVNGINSLINLAVFETNQGYAQSDVVMRMNLVHTREVSFTESGSMSTWVGQLRNTADGVIDTIHAVRDSYGADAVCMITNTGDYCGIAYNVWTSFATAQAANAFNVTQDSCATGYYSFGHELGHTLGAQHDRANTGGGALYPYCYGYRTVSGAYRSIMAYAPGTRINLWSNPGKRAPNNEVMGVANSEENWRVLNNVIATASAWRAHKDAGHQITTTFASNNQFAGNMFNIQPKDDINLTGVDVNTSAAAGTSVQARIWYRSGSYVGFENSSTGWTTLATVTGVSAGLNNPTPMNFSSGVTFHSGSTYGIYVELLTYPTTPLRYTNGTPTDFENNHLKLTTGVGKAVGFTGTTFASRMWNGRMRYRGANGQFSLTTTFASDNQFAGNMFTVTPAVNLTVNSFDLNVAGSGYVTVDVWYRTGSYSGFESNPSGWTFVGSDFKAVAAGSGAATRVTVGDVNLNAGTTYSFYVLLSSYGTSSQALRYTTGSTNYSNAHLTINGGIGRGNGAFTGAIFASRTWNGRIRYTLL